MKTLLGSCVFKGVGIHTGKTSTLTIRPLSVGEGIRLSRIGTSSKRVPLSPALISDDNIRSTVLKDGDILYRTPEHFLAALNGLLITDVELELDGEEFPILDGSAKYICDEILRTGLKSAPFQAPLVLKEQVVISEGEAELRAVPSDKTMFHYTFDMGARFPGKQDAFYDYDESFLETIAPARTFCFEKEIKALIESGLGVGGSLDNALVIGEQDYINLPLLKNECAKHKCLDLMGDLMVLGRPVIAAISGFKSGHALNMKLVRRLYGMD